MKKSSRMSMSGKQLIARYKGLESEHEVLKTVWEQCLHYYIPEAQGIIYGDKSEGERDQPFDFAGVKANNALSSGLFSNTISMGDEFFGFSDIQGKFDEDEDVTHFFTECAKLLLKYLQSSNFALESHEMLQYYTALETGVLYSEWLRDENKFHFSQFPISSCRIADNKDGLVRTIFREFEMTYAQCLEKWGDMCSPTTTTKAGSDTEMYQKLKILHVVMPRTGYNAQSMNNKEKKFASYYVELEEEHVLEESGYDTFPYSVPRFMKKAGSPYGRGMAFSCLPAMRELTVLRSDMLDGVELKLLPPIFMPDTSDSEDWDLSPGAVNYYNAINGQPVFYQPDIDLTSAAQHRVGVKEEVEDMFFVRLFNMLDDQQNMTAYEVGERVAEKVMALTPVISRLYEEFFSETITRCLMLLFENQIIKEQIPQKLLSDDGSSLEFTVNYNTKLDNKLKALDTSQIMNGLNQAAQIVQTATAAPQFANIIKIDEVIRRVFNNNNVDPDLLYTKEEFEQNQQQMQEAAQMKQTADTITDKVNFAPIDLQEANEDPGAFEVPGFTELVPPA